MKKNVMNWMLLAAMVLGLGMSVTSCKDDDEDKTSEQRRDDADALDTDEARTAFRWLCVLADATTLDDNWQKKTYEPTIGQASENNQYTRLVIVKDLAEAKVQFAKMADLDVNQLGATQTVNGGAAGTMTWTPSKEGAENLAEVTVNSKIMPHLQKLVYCTEEQTGQNGLFGSTMKGTAYYRFGDVIKDDQGYYWICVRPSFAPDKGDSHWINIFNAAESGGGKTMPADNVITKWNNLPKYNNQTIKLPTKLAYDREHIYNLSNLIWALINPEAYAQANVGINDGALGGFDYKYHGEKFLKAVGQYWEEKIDGYSIWEKLFNHTGAEMQKLKEMHFYYYGYSWKWGNTGYCYRYSTKKYEPKYVGKYSDDEEEFEFVDRGFDITHYANTPDSKALPYDRFTTDSEGKHIGTWVVRYMRGDKLKKNGKYTPYVDLGFTDVYRYNAKKNIAAGENVKQEEENDLKDPVRVVVAQPGQVLANDGNLYYDTYDFKGHNLVPVAVVMAVKNGVEAGTDYNVLCMALRNNNEGFESIYYRWGEKGQKCGGDSCQALINVPSIPLNGLATTTQLANGCGKSHNHPAAKACLTFKDNVLTPATRQSKGLSNWFLPSVSQWKLAMENAIPEGQRNKAWNDISGYLLKNAVITQTLTDWFNAANISSYLNWTSSLLWSSTPQSSEKAHAVGVTWTGASYDKDSNTPQLYPFIMLRFVNQ